MTKKPFWDYTIPAQIHEISSTYHEICVGRMALETGKTAYSGFFVEKLNTDKWDIEHIYKQIETLGGRRSFCRLPFQNLESMTFIWDDGAVEVEYGHKSGTVRTSFKTLNRNLALTLKDLMLPFRLAKKPRGKIFMVVQGETGPALHEINSMGETFESGNYAEDVVTKYRHVIADLKNHDPCGRIVLMNGAAGCGKTRMVRSMLTDVPNAMFILIPSNMISQIGSPTFLKTLLREQVTGRPFVLVIEDADEAIINRKQGNLSELSAVLNFSDGIFGAILDIRIVCTTNAALTDIDPAVLRPGRLCERIEIGMLAYNQANDVYKRITGQEGPFKDGNFYTLGEIYRVARGKATEEEKRLILKPKKAKIGFSVAADFTEEELDERFDQKYGGNELAGNEEGDEPGYESYQMEDDDLIDDDPED